MALQLSEVITAARGRHPAFEPRNVPNAALARFLTGLQRELVSLAAEKNRAFLAQQASIAFDVSSANAVGVVGAGTAGGLPVAVTNGAPAIVSAPVGRAAEVDVEDDATVHVSDLVVTSATATTLTRAAAGWVVNAHANRTVVITAGLGAGQRRSIGSNTATELTVDDAWDVIPDDTSIFDIVTEAIEDNSTFGVVAAAPFVSERLGYLVRLSATGAAYLDLTQPLVAKFAVGIPLPQHHHVLGGTVRFTDDDEGLPLTLVDYGSRHRRLADYSAYVLNGELFLVGDGEEWADVTSIDLRYVPIAPALTALSDYFLLPDSAYQALVDGAAWHAAVRVQGLVGVPKLDPTPLWEAKERSTAQFIKSAGRQQRAAFTRMRESR